MKKKTLKPSKDFISLFNQSESAYKEILQTLSKWTGYNVDWVGKNFSKCLGVLTTDQRKIIEEKFIWNQVLKQYLWSQYYFLNFEKVVKYVVPPSRVQYNHKTKLIELIDGNNFTEKVKKIVQNFKNDLEKVSKNFSSPINPNPPRSL